MKRIIILSVFLSILPYFVNAQGEANNWYFGGYAGFCFNSGHEVYESGGQTNCGNETCCISDYQGNLLFYSDGKTVWNRYHQVMPHGTGLYGCNGQTGVIVPLPNSTHIYFLFTISVYYVPTGEDHGFNYTVIDMNLDNGKGDVVDSTKNTNLLPKVAKNITAVVHGNKVDTWVMVHNWNSDQFYAYLITPVGLSSPVITSIGTTYSGINNYGGGDMKFSNKGSKLALAIEYYVNPGFNPYVELYDFNNTTGIVQNYLLINNTNFFAVQGVEFSPDESKMYVSDGIHIYQYNLNAGSPSDIINSVNMWYADGNGAIQLAPDGKIYISGGQTSSMMCIINQPNLEGNNCNMIIDTLLVVPPLSQSMKSIPNFITSYFSNLLDFSYQDVCAGGTVSFNILSNTALDTIHWNFGDTLSADSISVLHNPHHIFNQAGTYSVILTTHNGNLTHISQHEVVVFPVPIVNLGNDTIILPGASLTLDAGNPGCTYLWSTGDTTQVITVSQSNVYSVTVTNTSGCIATDEIELTILGINGIVNRSPVIDFDPFTGYLVINSVKPLFIEVYSASGKLIRSSGIPGTGKTIINLTDIPAGVYFIRVLEGENIIVKKIIRL
ncbi:MAG: T9SS type A sorting domain-containing protein [Bacteroidia bacterium]|nr:T9SS type A sorting domain-containing protein [Bacteroidia bacterium]